MIKKFVQKWEENKNKLRLSLTEHPENYIDLVKKVISILSEPLYDDTPDPEKIWEIRDGSDYSGNLIYIIGSIGSSKYWHILVSYGSCSACDTLESIRFYSDELTEERKNSYMTLMLHIIQGLKELNSEDIAAIE